MKEYKKLTNKEIGGFVVGLVFGAMITILILLLSDSIKLDEDKAPDSPVTEVIEEKRSTKVYPHSLQPVYIKPGSVVCPSIDKALIAFNLGLNDVEKAKWIKEKCNTVGKDRVRVISYDFYRELDSIVLVEAENGYAVTVIGNLEERVGTNGKYLYISIEFSGREK